MKRYSVLPLLTLFLGWYSGFGLAQTGEEHAHHSDVNSRGDAVMGFSHEKTTHHFHLFSDGGSIEVTANDPADAATRDQIQMHLSHIARMFAEGDFQAPMLVHDKIPPGSPVLRRLKADVTYRFEKMERGARIRIATRDPEAVSAVHEFLRFQILDHQTGDSQEVGPVPGK
jgi:hypothetical protein